MAKVTLTFEFEDGLYSVTELEDACFGMGETLQAALSEWYTYWLHEMVEWANTPLEDTDTRGAEAVKRCKLISDELRLGAKHEQAIDS
jgi:hypothetical protein